MDMTINTEIQSAAQQTVSALLNAQAPTTLRLGALYLDKRNVRKIKGKMPIADLAAAILREGLLQNLVVVPKKGKKKGQTHEVIAGGRRYQALMLLVEQGHITLDFMVSVHAVADEQATSASLVENVAREAMHPADELDAFAKLLEQGQSFETIGNTYGISAMTVRRRIKLLSVSPKLLKLLRTDEITLEQLAALSINDSHATQEQVWEQCKGTYYSDPEHLRERLTDDEIDAGEHRIAKFVGVEAYETAGGIVRRDLFSEDDTGYIVDAGLLFSLADAKLNERADALRADGWSWVETRHERDYNTLSRFGRISAAVVIPDDVKPTAEELNRNISVLNAEIEAYYESEQDSTDEEDEQNQVREQRCEQLEREKEELEARYTSWTAEQKNVAGVLLYIDHNGNMQTEYGLVRGNDIPVDASTGEAMEVKNQYGSVKQPKVRAAHADKMVARLTAHRTVAVQAVLMRRPDVALALLTARLAGEIFYQYGFAEHALQVRSTEVHRQLTSAADDMLASDDWKAVESEKEMWADKLPGSQAGLLPWLLQQTPETVSELMAFCVARSVDGLRQTERQQAPMDQLVDVLGIDMADHWQADEESYFGQISKNQMIAAITDAVSAEAAAPIAGLKKDAAAKLAEKTMEGVRWVPEPMRARATKPVQVDERDDE